MILEGKVPNIHENIKSRVSLWTCDIVWTDKPAHLHSLSYKCNDEQPHQKMAMQYEVREREQIPLVCYGLSGRSLRNLSVQCQSCNA